MFLIKKIIIKEYITNYITIILINYTEYYNLSYQSLQDLQYLEKHPDRDLLPQIIDCNIYRIIK